MAVRLDIRPRIRLAPDWQPGPRARRRFRLPPLALPAAGYWVAIAALTYGFTQLGPHPLDDAFAAPRVTAPARIVDAPAVTPLPAPAPAPLAEVATEAPPAEDPPALVPERDAPVAPMKRAEAPVAEPARPASTREAVSLPAEPASAAFTFPEFTDSAPARPRERASAGPRLDSLFERAEAHAEQAPPPLAAERAPERAAVALQSCEAAIARNGEQLEIGGPRGPADITREGYASILQNGSYLSGCHIPDRTVVEICAAVKQGRAVGVTVTSSPPSAELGACVRRAVSRLSFPHSEKLDVTHTRFDAVRR